MIKDKDNNSGNFITFEYGLTMPKRRYKHYHHLIV